MGEQYLDIRSVAIIGAGVSGVSAAVHLKRAGLDVTVFERNPRAGGIWVYNEKTAKDAAFPSEIPSVGDSPEYSSLAERFKRNARRDSPIDSDDSPWSDTDIATSFAPPGPCYIALKNNVSTIEMETTFQSWKPGTEEFVPHHVLADYIQDGAEANGVLDCIYFNTRVNHVRKSGKFWQVEIAQLKDEDGFIELTDSIRQFDALVIAIGHYHACNIPDIPGLSTWKKTFPHSVQHSKLYRHPKGFEGKNVLIVGAGVSSIDIARDLGPVARSVYQSSRGGMYDIPSHILPENAARIGAIRSFEPLLSSNLEDDGSIPGTVTLQSGEKICGIHHVILATGYHVSLPFMRQYHSDSATPEEADEHTLSTNGQVTHNLHKDIWYIKDPSLTFVGVPYHVATFSFFEFQAMAIANVLSGKVPLPLEAEMRQEYNERIKQKGAGRTFHSLKAPGAEIAYVADLVQMNTLRGAPMPGHTASWLEAYQRRSIRHKALFSAVRDPALDRRVMDLIVGC